MNKTQRHKEINKSFYLFVEEFFPQFTLGFEEGYGEVYLIENEITIMMYHQSEHYVCAYYEVDEENHKIENKLNDFLNRLKKAYELV